MPVKATPVFEMWEIVIERGINPEIIFKGRKGDEYCEMLISGGYKVEKLKVADLIKATLLIKAASGHKTMR